MSRIMSCNNGIEATSRRCLPLNQVPFDRISRKVTFDAELLQRLMIGNQMSQSRGGKEQPMH